MTDEIDDRRWSLICQPRHIFAHQGPEFSEAQIWVVPESRALRAEARVAELEREIERLRARTHEIAEAKDAEHATAMRDYGMMKRLVDEARERTKDWKPSATGVEDVSWMEYPGSWWTHSSSNSCMDVVALVAERVDAEDRAAELEAALEFYADPETYFAIGFLPDRPCGPFIDDGEPFGPDMRPCDEDTPYARWRPGKRARAALADLRGPEGTGS